jgi:hypothetical protein
MEHRRSGKPQAPGADVLEGVFAELGALYSDATCPRSTRCCRFKQTGRVPYVWPVEGRRVLAGIARRGGRLPMQGAPGDCPLILADGGCSVYADRPFGCRTFFCDDATLPHGNRRREVDVLAKRLRTASEGLGERELVPLTTILEQAFDREGRRKKNG